MDFGKGLGKIVDYTVSDKLEVENCWHKGIDKDFDMEQSS